MQNLLLIRADITQKDATGHVMRCLTLAHGWQDRGGKVVFLGYFDCESMKQRISKEGFDLISIDSPCPNQKDLKQTLNFLQSLKACTSNFIWTVLDGYHFNQNYQKAIAKVTHRLMIIDDLNNYPYYHADILLNQNFNSEHILYNCDNDTKLLLGSKYIMLRKDFLKHKKFVRKIPKKATNILIMSGGADIYNIIPKVILSLQLVKEKKLKVKVVVGPMNSKIEYYKKISANSFVDFQFLYNISNISELLIWADIAIICAGGTLWECLFMGCPVISFAVNKIQHSVLQLLHNMDAVFYIGYVSKVLDQDLIKSIENIIISKKLRSVLSMNSKKIIDGNGVSRIIDEMIGGKTS